jgi:hypothetical protein
MPVPKKRAGDFIGTDDHRFNERKFPIKLEVPYRQPTAGYRCASALKNFSPANLFFIFS